MKRIHLTLIVIGIIVLVAVLTNPSQDKHREAIKSKLNAYLQQSMKESLKETDNEWEQAGQALGLMIGGAFVDRIIDNLISTENYVIFSTTKMTWDGQTKVVGIGAFGNVFLTSKVDDALNDSLLKNIK